MLPEPLIHLLEFISKYKIFGFIPLNATLHFTITTLISLFLYKREWKVRNILIFIFFLGLSKEIFDSFALGNTIEKHIRDMCINLTFPSLLAIYDKVRIKIAALKSDVKSQKQEHLR